MSTLKDNSLFERRWALLAIFIGTVAGLGSAVLCIVGNLVIFGFNIMYIISPLFAGFVETFVARKKYGQSTGAISALVTFILINAYGWLAPGFLFPEEPVSLSIITIFAIALMIQAAFPILVNYIILVVAVGIFIRFINLPYSILGVEQKAGDEYMYSLGDEVSVDGLIEPLVSVPDVEGKNIKQYLGLVTGEAVAKEKEKDGTLEKMLKMIQPKKLGDLHLSDARNLAVSRMLERGESLGADNVVEVTIDYVSMGGLQGSATIVAATGTAVVYGKE